MNIASYVIYIFESFTTDFFYSLNVLDHGRAGTQPAKLDDAVRRVPCIVGLGVNFDYPFPAYGSDW